MLVFRRVLCIYTYIFSSMYVYIYMYLYGTAAPIYTWHVYGTSSGGLHLRPLLWTCQKPDQDSPPEPPQRLGFVGICSAVHRGINIWKNPNNALNVPYMCIVKSPQMGNLMIPDQYMVESLQIIRDVLFQLEVFMYIVILVTICVCVSLYLFCFKVQNISCIR